MKNIRSIWKQILTVRKWFAELEIKFEPFKRDSKHSNANSNDSNNSTPNSNHSTGIGSIWMQIRTILKIFKDISDIHIRMQFLPIRRSIRMQIRTIWKGFEAFKSKFQPYERDSKHSNANSNHSKGIRSIRMQIQTIRT